MDAEDLLFLMYTSGTTAKPKGIAHTTGGYLVGVASTHALIFDLKPEEDVYWCAADIGWITGHSYIVYGPLTNGATSVLYEGTPDFPDKDRWWEIVERYGVTILYTAPTAIRAHMKWGPEHAAKHELSTLRLLGSVGEPINPEAWMWYREHVGGDRCPVVDTWWQTETGMIMITPLPGVTTTKPGSATKPFPGVEAGVFNEAGEEVGPGGGGYLVLKRPWPAMTRGIYGDDARFRQTYWEKYPGVYFAGDGARIDEDGDFWLLGRVDDVMNVSGHRISTIEVESALVDHPSVAEAAVCGRADALTGQAIVAYVTLKGGDEGSVEMLEELRNHVAAKIGPIAKPANIVFTPELPKTRSGKIMRRLLRDVAENRPLGDTTTLADPTVVQRDRRPRRPRTPPRNSGESARDDFVRRVAVFWRMASRRGAMPRLSSTFRCRWTASSPGRTRARRTRWARAGAAPRVGRRAGGVAQAPRPGGGRGQRFHARSSRSRSRTSGDRDGQEHVRRRRPLGRGAVGRLVGRRAALPHAGLHRHPPRPRAGRQGRTARPPHFVTDGIESALEQAREAAGGKDVALGGGANVAQPYLKAGLIDELQLHVVPVLLGAGARLFDNSGTRCRASSARASSRRPASPSHLPHRELAAS